MSKLDHERWLLKLIDEKTRERRRLRRLSKDLERRQKAGLKRTRSIRRAGKENVDESPIRETVAKASENAVSEIRVACHPEFQKLFAALKQLAVLKTRYQQISKEVEHAGPGVSAKIRDGGERRIRIIRRSPAGVLKKLEEKISLVSDGLPQRVSALREFSLEKRIESVGRISIAIHDNHLLHCIEDDWIKLSSQLLKD